MDFELTEEQSMFRTMMRGFVSKEIEPHAAHDLEALLYVGCSRARNHLVVLASDALAPDVREKLSS